MKQLPIFCAVTPHARGALTIFTDVGNFQEKYILSTLLALKAAIPLFNASFICK